MLIQNTIVTTTPLTIQPNLYIKDTRVVFMGRCILYIDQNTTEIAVRTFCPDLCIHVMVGIDL